MNSPKLGSTPVKRLGIAWRKSSPIVQNLIKNTITSVYKNHSKNGKNISEVILTPSKLLKSFQDIENKCPNKSNEDPLVVGVDQNIFHLEQKLRNLEEVSELDESIMMWRNGCKEALIELQALVRTKEDVKMSCKTLSKKLGIWSVIKDNFQDDSEIVSSDEDESH